MNRRSPFPYFKTSREIIRLAVMLYIRLPLSLPNVENLLHERGADVSHETIRYWWHKFGPMFASETGRWMNNRAENSHLPFRQRERAVLRLRRMRSLQKFACVHASVLNHFNQERSLSNRTHLKLNRAAALAEWHGLCAE